MMHGRKNIKFLNMGLVKMLMVFKFYVSLITDMCACARMHDVNKFS